MLKKLILIAASLLLVLPLAGCGKNSLADSDALTRAKLTNQIFWGVKYDTRLFGLMDVKTGEVQGFDIDIAKALTKEILGSKGHAVFIEVTSKTRIPLLKNGNIDAIIATMTITDERKKQVDFSDVYFAAGQSLLVKKTSPIKSIEDLKGKRVLAVKGSTSAENIKKAVPSAHILELENYSECFTALKSNQGDAMTTDNAILLGMASQNHNYHLVGGTFTDEPYGIAVNKGQQDLLEAINDALKTIHENGEYDKIYAKWIGGVK
ncbi:MAG: transporter substrate-binding domain-containing protein [Lactobacillales bacterium]|jgi:putative glutamine transport system substrate-binding protein|nr:transporter substrate-binding domain-containing protein [Lactobacillales bacterium]